VVRYCTRSRIAFEQLGDAQRRNILFKDEKLMIGAILSVKAQETQVVPSGFLIDAVDR
jgi:hypothetical protein